MNDNKSTTELLKELAVAFKQFKGLKKQVQAKIHDPELSQDLDEMTAKLEDVLKKHTDE